MDVDSYNNWHHLYFFNTFIIKSGVFAAYLLHLSRLVLNGASSSAAEKPTKYIGSETPSQSMKRGSISTFIEYLIRTSEINVFLSWLVCWLR